MAKVILIDPERELTRIGIMLIEECHLNPKGRSLGQFRESVFEVSGTVTQSIKGAYNAE